MFDKDYHNIVYNDVISEFWPRYSTSLQYSAPQNNSVTKENKSFSN